MNEKRKFKLCDGDYGPGPVVYWMSRDQRADDNWALLFAQDDAVRNKRPLLVVFCLVPEFLHAGARQYGFMVRGLAESAETLKKKNVGFVLLKGDPGVKIPAFLKKLRARCLYADFDPLRVKREWKNEVVRKIRIPAWEVDAHNVVPCRYVSDKREFAAYTIRPKINRALDVFLDEFPKLKKMPGPPVPDLPGPGFDALVKGISKYGEPGEVDRIKSGPRAAKRAMRRFLKKGLGRYDGERNDPNADAQSGLSPYLHFGQLSAQRVALEALKTASSPAAAGAFMEELVMRRELSDNFCWYEKNYDSVEAFPDWASKTLRAHEKDEREYVYTLDEFENAVTHDDLWNAAQREMRRTGKMHGYMRMYWAKKILEWMRSPEEAMRVAICLNDRYELDGRDPNGYAGVAWSIGGVHDRAWGERTVFGKVRYMSRKGCERKFDVKRYIESNV